jgi:hypothetical protein
MEPHVNDIARVIQLAVAPVFLLTAVATLINALNIRLGRAIDRRRVLLDQITRLSGDALEGVHDELRILFQRVRLVYFAILAAVVGALLVCLVVASAFVGALTGVDISRIVAVLFILSMFAMIACLGILLREVFVAVAESTSHHRIFFAKVDSGR